MIKDLLGLLCALGGVASLIFAAFLVHPAAGWAALGVGLLCIGATTLRATPSQSPKKSPEVPR